MTTFYWGLKSPKTPPPPPPISDFIPPAEPTPPPITIAKLVRQLNVLERNLMTHAKTLSEIRLAIHTARLADVNQPTKEPKK